MTTPRPTTGRHAARIRMPLAAVSLAALVAAVVLDPRGGGVDGAGRDAIDSEKRAAGSCSRAPDV